MTENFQMAYNKQAYHPMGDVRTEIKLHDIDSRPGIQEIINENGVLKGVEILSCLRKEAVEKGASLGRFVVKQNFLLDDDGNVSIILPETFENATDKKSFFDVMHAKEFIMAAGIDCLHTRRYM